MDLNKYEAINNIHSSKYDWQCRLRLQSFWKGINRKTKEYYGLNMIFIDDSNSRIHAFASAKYCQDLVEKLVEGEIYTLSNFKVKDYLGDEIYRPVRNQKHIYFTQNTKLEKDAKGGLEIEEYAFDLFDMEEIDKLADDNRFLIDMIGRVQNIQELVTTTKNDQETTRLKFEIFDGRHSVKVTLFDIFGKTVQEKFKIWEKKDFFVIIACARVGRYDGAPNLTNYPPTGLYIEPNHYSVQEMKIQFEALSRLTLSNVETNSAREVFTVKEIRKLSAEFINKLVNCEVMVKKVDDKSTWYYAKCTDCDIEIFRKDGIYKCTKCPRIYPYPDKRFRVCTICSDGTGSIAIIFPDSEVTRITDTTVVDIHSDCLEENEEDKFPDILKVLVNQKYTTTLEIKEENVKKGSTIYQATEILDCIDSSDTFDPTKQITMETEEPIHFKDTENKDQNLTPHTGNSTNIKSRLRKNLDPVAYDLKDDELIKPSKFIKLEKK